jgi:hypothetical protein
MITALPPSPPGRSGGGSFPRRSRARKLACRSSVQSPPRPVLWSGTATAGSYSGYAGGAFGAQTDIGDCSQVPDTSNNDYAIAFDTVSGRWSNELPLDSDCASF